MAENTSPTNLSGQIMDVAVPQPAPVPPQPPAESPEVVPAPSSGDTEGADPVPHPEAVPAETKPATTKVPPLGVPLGNKTAHQHRAPIGVILVASLVTLLLAGLTVYAWHKNQTIKPSAQSIASPKTAGVAINTSTVDKTSSSLDSSIKQLDDSKDLSTNDLSNTSLGL